jgi:hypothetical protein
MTQDMFFSRQSLMQIIILGSRRHDTSISDSDEIYYANVCVCVCIYIYLYTPTLVIRMKFITQMCVCIHTHTHKKLVMIHVTFSTV